MRLAKPDGIVGLLTPSGIYADKTAARFFKTVSTSGRVGGLFDFENRKIFFPDVHASFKFCALIFGGQERRFAQTDCAFFLHDTATDRRPRSLFPPRCRRLRPRQSQHGNRPRLPHPPRRRHQPAASTRATPSSWIAPAKRRDPRLAGALRAYARHDQRLPSLSAPRPQLDDDGFYPVQGNRWKRGEDLYLPLYQDA